MLAMQHTGVKAMVLRRQAKASERPLHLEERSAPEPGEGELRVRVRACGVCRTDLHVVEGDLRAQRLPLVPGHQIVGTVEQLGPGCRLFRPGDRVGIAWLRHTCGQCAHCLAGRENLCPQSRYTGWHEDGGYAEQAVAPEAYVYAIPPAFEDAQAAPLLCAGIIGYRALRRCELPPNGRLGLFGFGSSAHVVAQIAQHRGHEVMVSTRGGRHRALAAAMRASWVGEPGERFPAPLDAAIVFAPAGALVPEALRAVRPGGSVVTAGITMTEVPPMSYEECLFHEKRLTSVESNTREDGRGLWREALAAGVRPRVEGFPLESAGDALLKLAGDQVEGSAVLVFG